MKHLKRRRHTARIVLTLLIAVSLLATALPPIYPPPVSTARAQGDPPLSYIAPRGGEPYFVIGANYEGPTDSAWMMWEDGKFDPDRINQDFMNARWAGVNTLRIFVQKPLRDDVNAGDFSKLDTVMSLARKHNLLLILTFTDWPEPDLVKAASLNAQIAAHLAGEPQILAYDVKNEPQFTDVAGAIYPATSAPPPLQSAELISQYGERVTRASLAEYRKGEGRNIVPARMSDDQAYLMANYYKLFVEFLNAGAAWVKSRPNTTTLDYIDSPDSAHWSAFLAGIDATLAEWVNTQFEGVRRADPGRPLTVGYSNIVFAKMPSNKTLDFQSIHRFTAHGYAGVNATFRVLDNLQRAFAGQPVLLEEFGYPGQVKATGGGVTAFDPRTTANLESAIWTYLYSRGFAGGMKWMLNNFPNGYDPAQNSFGMFDNDGKPKIAAHALRQLAAIFSRTRPGAFSRLQAEENSAVGFLYDARNATVTGGKVHRSETLVYTATAPSQLFTEATKGTLNIIATDVATLEVNLPGQFTVPTGEIGRITLQGLNPDGQPWTPPAPTLSGDWLRVAIKPLYTYRLSATPRAVDKAEAQAGADTVYFPQTGHNLGGEFLRYWQARGGLSIFGYPLTEPFTEAGRTVQYFERNRFELHPQNQPPYNVLLGRMGADAVAGRRFQKVEPFASGPNHRYFPETGYSLHFAFLGYWDRNGGLAQFGYPISEEIKERSRTDGKEYTVQYFERARMEYHPEYGGTDAEVLLGLLGANTMKEKGWLP